MTQKRFEYLIEKFRLQQLQDEDRQELMKVIKGGNFDILLKELILTNINHNEKDIEWTPEYENQILKSILERKSITVAHRIHFLKTAWFRYAAAILLILGVAAYVFTSQLNKEKRTIVAEKNAVPGTDKAILTLSDGKQVILDNAEIENIADGNISIKKADGVLTYNTGLTTDAINLSYNTMNTPRGGQYQLVLPDGSKVWLNSASSLKYPTVFKGENKIVELSGEAYFDIKANKEMPFIVKTQNADVLVLGTAFNINSYSDEPAFSATLIDGSVKVSAGSNAKVLSPGQQAQLLKSGPNNIEIKNGADVNQIIAWQKGIFEFDGATIDIIGRQLSRWYDVDVVVRNNAGKKLSGGINKKTPLKTVLDNLEASGIGYKWDNNILELYSY